MVGGNLVGGDCVEGRGDLDRCYKNTEGEEHRRVLQKYRGGRRGSATQSSSLVPHKAYNHNRLATTIGLQPQKAYKFRVVEHDEAVAFGGAHGAVDAHSCTWRHVT